MEISGIILDLGEDGFTLKTLKPSGVIQTNIILEYDFFDEKTIKLKLLENGAPFIIKL